MTPFRFLHNGFKRVMLAASLLLLGGALPAPGLDDEGCPLVQKPGIIAHRCYNAAESAPENSLEALRQALLRDYLYAVEMDVWVTADGVVVVHHDDSMGGLSLERSCYDELRDFRLANGEALPTLASFLELLQKTPHIKAVIEIKEHACAQNGLRAADAVSRLVQEYGLEEQVEYQSFDEEICKRLMSQHPERMVGYAKGDRAPAELRSRGFRIMDYHYGVLFTTPSLIEEARLRGMRANGYTMNSCADMLHAANLGIDCITTDFPEALRALLEWRENSALRPLLTHEGLTQALCALRNTPLAIVYALQEACQGAALAVRELTGLRSLSLIPFCSLLCGGLLLFAWALLAVFSWRRRAASRPQEARRGRLWQLLLSFCSPCGRMAPRAFWWRQLLLIFPLYLGTYGACLAGKYVPGLAVLDETAVISVLLTQLCPPCFLASGLACVKVHYAGIASTAPGLGLLASPLLALFCLLVSLLAAWCCFALVLRRLRDSRPGLWTLPLCLSILWTQFIMLTAHRPVWLDDALIILVLLVPVLCISLPSRRREGAE